MRLNQFRFKVTFLVVVCLRLHSQWICVPNFRILRVSFTTKRRCENTCFSVCVHSTSRNFRSFKRMQTIFARGVLPRLLRFLFSNFQLVIKSFFLIFVVLILVFKCFLLKLLKNFVFVLKIRKKINVFKFPTQILI